MIAMGYSRKEIEEALLDSSYNDVMATYLLLAKEIVQVDSILLASFSQVVVSSILG